MREVKFRGWLNAGEFSGWRYGYLTRKYNPDGETLTYYIEDENYKAWEVVPESIGEFTGLYDQNGKEIYEGDIVKDPWNTCREVFLRLGCWFVSLYKELGYIDDIEIVGNAFENPKLLNKDCK